jgi:hypothetical protein
VTVVIATTVIIAAVGIPIFARKSPQENGETKEEGGVSNSP